MSAAEFGAALLADFDRRLDAENAARLQPSPHPFGALHPGPFGGGPNAVIPAHARTRDWPTPSPFMLHIMAANDATNMLAQHNAPQAQASSSSRAQEKSAAPNAPLQGLSSAPDFKLASSAVGAGERAVFGAESATMAQKRRLLDQSAGLDCSFMGVGNGVGAWDAGSEETARRVATLQARLQQRLGPEFVSTRAGPSGGPKVSYIEGWKAIDLANEVFGFNGWSSSIVSIDVDFLEENPETGRVNVAVSVTVRVTLRDGTFHEDVGYGSMDNSKSRAAALEKSKKEAVTDALKRTLRTFGKVLGNCLYDKQFLRDVSKVTLPPVKFDPSTLHRRPELAHLAANKISASTSAPSESNVSAADGGAMGPPRPAAIPRSASTVVPQSAAQVASSEARAAGPPQAASPTKSPGAGLNRSHTMATEVATKAVTPAVTRPQAPAAPQAGVSSNDSNAGRSAAGAVTPKEAPLPAPPTSVVSTTAASTANASASEKARLAEQRRVEAQKRLARTKSMQASVGAHSATTTSTSTSAAMSADGSHQASHGDGTSAGGPSPVKNGPTTTTAPPPPPPSRRFELPSFGPQTRGVKVEPAGSRTSVVTTATTGAAAASTPFGPRFATASASATAAAAAASKPTSASHDDSAIFMPSDGAGEDGETNAAAVVGWGIGVSHGLSGSGAGGAGGGGADVTLDSLHEGERSVRAPSVGRFTGLTPNSAQLLRGGSTTLSAAGGTGAAPPGQSAGTDGGTSAGLARKDSLCGPLQSRRSFTAAGENGVRAPPLAGPGSGTTSGHGHSHSHGHGGTGIASMTAGIEGAGLTERMSGVGSGVGKVRGIATSGHAMGSGGGGGPASTSTSLRSAVRPPGASVGGPGVGLKRVSEGAMADLDPSKRVRR